MPIKDLEKRKEANKRYYEKRKGTRSRGWACIVYPESAPENWTDTLNEAHIETLISPLHDKDVTAEGSQKKPHYHVLGLWPQPVPAAAAAEYFGLIGVTAPPEMVKNSKGYARYLVHMDDHDKHRYSEHDVTALAGADWYSVALDEGEAINAYLDEIESFIDDNSCISYRALCGYARECRPEWTEVIRHNTIHLMAYIKSFEWEIKMESLKNS